MVQVRHQAVDAGADEPSRHQLLEDMQMLALAVSDHRGEDHDPRPLRQRHDLVHHLADGLGVQGFAVLGAARFADAGVQQPQVVVDFGDGAHRRARVVRS